jgi:hypothetical protein
MSVTSGAAGAIHIVMQSKGGVGKSFVASHLAQYFADSGMPIKVFDSDPTTPTLVQYKALGATYLNSMKDDELDVTTFDQLSTGIEKSSKEVVVVDTGSSNFIALGSYLKNQHVLEVLAEQGRRVVLHSVLVGGPGARETLSGLVEIAGSLVAHDYVAWLNSFFGPVVFDGKAFEETRGYGQVKHKLRGTIRIKERTGGNNVLHLNAMRKMAERHLTYREVFESPDFSLWEKQRLKDAQREIYEQLAGIFAPAAKSAAVAAAT